MKILVTAATGKECMIANESMLQSSHQMKGDIHFHVSGVGIPATLFSIAHEIEIQKPTLVIQVGIAGCFNIHENIYPTYVIKNEVFADIGVEENGEWKDVFDMGFLEKNIFPYTEKRLENPWLEKYNLLKLPAVAAITVNEATTRNERIGQYVKKYNPFLESMEGAALHYVCLMKSIPFIQLRTISNVVGDRHKKNWQIKPAIEHLNAALIKYIDALYSLNLHFTNSPNAS